MCRLASRWLRRLLVYSSVQPSRPVQPSDQPVFLFIFLTLRRIDLTARTLSTLLWPRHDGASIVRKTRLRCRRTSLRLEKFRRRLVGSMAYSGSWCIVVELLFQFFLIIAFAHFQKPVINRSIMLCTVYVNLYFWRLALCVYDVVVMFRSLYCNIYRSLELWQCLFRDVDIFWIRVCDVLHFILLVLLSQDSIFSIISQCWNVRRVKVKVSV